MAKSSISSLLFDVTVEVNALIVGSKIQVTELGKMASAVPGNFV